MRAARATLPWVLLAVALAAWWPRPAPPAIADPPPPEVASRLALASISLPPPPPAPPAAEPGPPLAPAPAVRPLAPAAAHSPAPAPDIVPLRPRTAPPVAATPAAVVTPLRPEPATAPAAPDPTPPPPAGAPVDSAAADGRTLLRLLEHGRGPQISIDWPGGREADRLVTRLARCHGMRVALLDDRGRLWRDNDPVGQPWEINFDRFSGFLRVGAGDDRMAAEIRRRHRVSGQPVRLFPRAVDAHLLASLRQAVGGGYGAAQRISLRYRLDGGRVVLDLIRVDGRPLPGRIRLAGMGGCDA